MLEARAPILTDHYENDLICSPVRTIDKVRDSAMGGNASIFRGQAAYYSNDGDTRAYVPHKLMRRIPNQQNATFFLLQQQTLNFIINFRTSSASCPRQ